MFFFLSLFSIYLSLVSNIIVIQHPYIADFIKQTHSPTTKTPKKYSFMVVSVFFMLELRSMCNRSISFKVLY